MAISLVAHVAAGSSNGGSSVTTSSIDTTGATLLVVVVSYNYLASPTVTDNKSNTYTGLTAQVGNDNACRIFICAAPTVGTGHTFSASGSSSFPTICVGAFSGITGTTADQQNGTTSVTGGTGVSHSTTGSITPAQNGELVIVAVGTSNSTFLPTVVSGDGGILAKTDSVSLVGSQHYSGAMFQGAQSVAATINPDIAFGATGAPWSLAIASLNGSGGGGLSVGNYQRTFRGVIQGVGQGAR